MTPAEARSAAIAVLSSSFKASSTDELQMICTLLRAEFAARATHAAAHSSLVDVIEHLEEIDQLLGLQVQLEEKTGAAR